MKQVKGFFILIVKQFDSTMPSSDYHYTTWCIANTEYCRFYHADELKKFDSFEEAERFGNQYVQNTSHDIKLEVAYLTTTGLERNPTDSNLNHWVQVSSEQEAVDYDVLQKKEPTTTEFDPPTEDVCWWDTTQFHSIYS